MTAGKPHGQIEGVIGAPEPYTHTWTTNECGNPDPNLNWEDIPQAHPKTDDLKRDCPGWEWKETK